MLSKSKSRNALFISLVALGLIAVSTAAKSAFRPMPEVPENCGFNEEPVPSFSLPDVNANSSTYGTQVELTDILGQVLVIYWANAN